MAAALAAIALSGCTGPTGSGIYGTAMMGPTCPVERNPPDPNCADRPYTGTLLLEEPPGTIVREFNSSADGSFNVSADPGRYVIRSPSGTMGPTCTDDGTITVIAGRFTRADVACDTHIR
jgi:hypothetical protein